MADSSHRPKNKWEALQQAPSGPPRTLKETLLSQEWEELRAIPRERLELFPAWAEPNLIHHFERAALPEYPPLADADILPKGIFAALFESSPAMLKHPAVRRVWKLWGPQGNEGRKKKRKLEGLAGKRGQVQTKPEERRGKGRPRRVPEAFDLLCRDFDQIVAVLEPSFDEVRGKRNRRAFWDAKRKALEEVYSEVKGEAEAVRCGLMRPKPLLLEASLDDLAGARSVQEAARRILIRRHGLKNQEWVKKVIRRHRNELRRAYEEGRLTFSEVSAGSLRKPFDLKKAERDEKESGFLWSGKEPK